MTVKLRALKPHQYAGKERAIDDEYPASESDAKVLMAVGWVELVAEPIEPPRKRAYRRRDMAAE